MRRILIITAVLLGVAWVVWSITRPEPLFVVLDEVKQGLVEASVANTRAGSIEACQRTRLSPIVGGRIVYLGVKKGDHVKKDQVLIRLWNDDQQAQNKLAISQLESAKKHVGEVCSLADSAEWQCVLISIKHLQKLMSQK